MPNPYYNVLQSKTAVATASSTLNTGNFKAANAIDGSYDLTKNSTTRWVSQGGLAGEWLQIDLDSIVSVNKFVLYSGNTTDSVNVTNAIKDANVQVWINDAWLTVWSFRGNADTGFKKEVVLDQFYKTDKIRVYFPIDSTSGNFRVFEIEAYGRILGRKAKGTSSKNLLKPFTSAEWNYTSAINSVEPSKLVLQMDGSKTNELIIPAKPNTTYTLSGRTTGRVYFVQRVGSGDKAGTGLSNYNTFSRTITTGSDVTGLRVSCTTDTAGTIEFEKLMLNEGNFPQPFQVYEQNMYPAIIRGYKKNMVPSFYRWVPSNAANVTVKSVSDTAITFNAVSAWGGMWAFFPVEAGKTYTFNNFYGEGATSSADARYYLRWIMQNGREDPTYVNLLFNPTFTAPAGAVSAKISAEATTTGAGKDITFIKPQLEEGSVSTPYERRQTRRLPAKRVVQKNWVNPKNITLRAGTTYLNVKGNRLEFNGNQDYAGVNHVVNDADFAGKTVTWSVTNRSAAVTPMLAYSQGGTMKYVGADLTTNMKTLLIPIDATQVRFYLQNNAGSRGDFFVEGWQIELSDKQTPYTPYKYSNKPAVLLTPKKNMMKPFTSSDWTVTGAASIIDELTMRLAATAPFQGVPCIMDIEPNTTYTFSFEWTGTGPSVTPNIMMYSGTSYLSSAFNNAVTNPTGIITFTTLANCNRLKFLMQNSGIAGTFTFTKLQLEKGSVKTPFEKYALQARRKLI